MSTKSEKKLLLIGPSTGAVHLENYYNLIRDYFDDILVITTDPIDYCKYEVISFSFRSPLKIRSQIKQFREVMDRFDPSVIHVHQANTGGYLAAKANKRKYPMIVTCWGSDVLVLPNQGILKRMVVKGALKNADFITADAQYMAQAIRELGIKNEVVLANFGINLREDLDLNKEKIIYSNRLHKELYNIDEIIKGFSEFVKEFKDWKLIVGAKGPNTTELENLANELLPENTYEFIGFVDQEENNRQYARAQIWVSIPDSDGTAISLLEAMGYGCIPVVSDLPANKEWITDGENGIIMDDNLKNAIKKAVQLNQDAVARQNKKLILEKGTKEVNKSIFEQIYNSIHSE
ncbi:MAG: glycosyltransferase family 4 protein [Crocinitomicaceae bacterium]|nr:glycosyltransferase family 4 protein [Crocinitomicaceae bacterium]